MFSCPSISATIEEKEILSVGIPKAILESALSGILNVLWTDKSITPFSFVIAKLPSNPLKSNDSLWLLISKIPSVPIIESMEFKTTGFKLVTEVTKTNSIGVVSGGNAAFSKSRIAISNKLSVMPAPLKIGGSNPANEYWYSSLRPVIALVASPEINLVKRLITSEFIIPLTSRRWKW